MQACLCKRTRLGNVPLTKPCSLKYWLVEWCVFSTVCLHNFCQFVTWQEFSSFSLPGEGEISKEIYYYTRTFIVPSSEPVATSCIPRRDAAHELTNEVCPFSFLILFATAQSHTAPVLSVDAVNTML